MSLIFVIGILNLVLGFALAVYLRRQHDLLPAISLPPSPALVEEPQEIEIPESQVVVAEPEPEPKPEEVVEVEEIPEEWLEMLEEESIEAGSFVEASVQVLKLEVGRYRARLMAREEEVRECMTTLDQDTIHEILVSLKELNNDWLAKQAEAAGHLGDRRGDLGNFEESGGALEDVLLDQAAQIETTCSNIEMLDFEEDVPAGCKRLLNEIARLIDLAHTLRDRMQESMVTIMKADQRLDSLDRNLQFDAASGLHNRVGLEVHFDEWWRNDISRERLVSVALIDIDRFSKVNNRWGTDIGDKVLGAFGHLIDELLHKDRGYERAMKYAGQSFLVFYGDTGPRTATGNIERIRQTIEATTFDFDGDEIELTVSCAVSEIDKKDTTLSLFNRLHPAIRAAKKAGRNHCTIDEGSGPQIVEPPEFQVKGRVVRVSETY